MVTPRMTFYEWVLQHQHVKGKRWTAAQLIAAIIPTVARYDVPLDGGYSEWYNGFALAGDDRVLEILGAVFDEYWAAMRIPTRIA